MGLLTLICLLFMAAPVDGKVKKRKPKRKPVVVKVEQQKQMQEEVIDAFNDSLAADALALLGDTQPTTPCLGQNRSGLVLTLSS